MWPEFDQEMQAAVTCVLSAGKVDHRFCVFDDHEKSWDTVHRRERGQTNLMMHVHPTPSLADISLADISPADMHWVAA